MVINGKVVNVRFAHKNEMRGMIGKVVSVIFVAK